MLSRLKDKLFYGWIIVIAFLIAGTTLFGIHLSFGVFFKSIANEFHLTRSVTSAISSVNFILAGISSFLFGRAVDRYGPRRVIFLMGLISGFSLLLTSQVNSTWQLFITYSLLLSLGTGAIFVVLTSTISRWFDKKRGLAFGIAGAGSGIGTFLMAPFATYLIANFNWRTAYIVIGVIAWLVVIPISRLLKKDPYEIGARPDGANSLPEDITYDEENIPPTDFSLLQLFRDRNYWLITVIWLLYAPCFYLVLTHLVPHTTDTGFSAGEAALALSLVGALSIAGRIIMGNTSDRIGRKLTATICALFLSGAMIWLVWAQELWMVYLFASVFGFAFGGLGASLSALIGDSFELDKIGTIIGVLNIGWAIGAAAGPAMGGIIFDINRSYSIAFLIGAANMAVVSLLIMLVRQKTSRNYRYG